MSLEKNLILLKQIDDCFLALNGKNLPSPANISDRYKWLHEDAPYSILAQNADAEPYFIYANKYALSCFRYTDEEILTFPSSFSAAIENRHERELLFNKVAQDSIVYNYTGERVDKYKNSFIIHDTIVWQLENTIGDVWGQGALFWREEKQRPDWYFDV
ncbi:MEKHLA domain-containing protein [Flavobacterium sp. LS1R47]|jgi:hypothetical protein|uniref:MEKHLA domain-containing protein n=1 Tax=Flavobacterium frigoritolerans TaxID=2987686 RepID=A0A9X2ZPC9_9FLAO|nr:MEKHLA domain-containing protein [Flavobacterium frigoritolerans]MCV9933165.1 MEKHLA domain-containing protein [Flavobacterium frigoritolerans]